MTFNTLIGILIPLAGTALGSAFVFLLRGELKSGVQKLLLGFASGVMIAASVWSLLIPAIDMAAEQGVTPWLPAAVGFIAGIAFLLLLDTVVPHQHQLCPRHRFHRGNRARRPCRRRLCRYRKRNRRHSGRTSPRA